MKWDTLKLVTIMSDLIILIYQVVLIIGVTQIFHVYCNTRWLDCQPGVFVQPSQVVVIGTRAVGVPYIK